METTGSSHVRAALPHALRFLERRDVVRLTVAALDARHVALALWLLFGDAYPLILDERQCLHVAAAEGCWTATAMLLRKLRAEPTADPALSSEASLFERAVTIHRSVAYEFPAAVMYRAVARGELREIQWLHTTTRYSTWQAVQCAARARQLPVVQWLLDHIQAGERLQCWLRLEDSPADVRAIGWICQTDDQIHFCGLSQPHGFTKRTENLWDPNARVPDLPLAEPFAEHGDQQALCRLLESHDERLFSRYAIVNAARSGQLSVVQWLYGLSIHTWPVASAMVEAAGNGHLAVVQWLFQFPDSRIPEALNRAIEGGHLHVARWILAQDCPQLHVSEYSTWSAAAQSMQLPVLRFVREQLGFELAPISALFLGLTGDRAVVEYIVDHVLPPGTDCETLVFDTAKKGTLGALQYLINERGFWSRKAFRAAIQRRENGLVVAQWIYEAARQRANRETKAIETVLDFSDINVFEVARDTSIETAIWLLESVSEVSAHGLLLGVDAFHPDRLAHTSTSVLDGDTRPGEFPVYAADVDRLLTAWVDKVPDSCEAIPWLPQWAIRTNAQGVFDRLVDIDHPSLFTTDTRDCVIAFSRNAYFMNTILAHEPPSLYAPTVNAWAAKYRLLDRLHIPGDV